MAAAVPDALNTKQNVLRGVIVRAWQRAQDEQVR
jgi:hypothetical protein